MTSPARNRFDFHCHSAASDGRDAPLALYAAMQRWGLRAAAITDHDTLEGLVGRHLPGRRVTLEDIAFLEEIFGKLVTPA